MDNKYCFPIWINADFIEKIELDPDFTLIPITESLRKDFFGLSDCQFDNNGNLTGCNSSIEAPIPIPHFNLYTMISSATQLKLWNSNYLLISPLEVAKLFTYALKLVVIGNSGLIQGVRMPPTPGSCGPQSNYIPYYEKIPLTVLTEDQILCLKQIIEYLKRNSIFSLPENHMKFPRYFSNFLKALNNSHDTFLERVTYLVHSLEGLLCTKKRKKQYKNKDIQPILVRRITKLLPNSYKEMGSYYPLIMSARNINDHGDNSDLISKDIFIKTADLIRNLIVLSLYQPTLFTTNSLKNLDD